MGDEMKRALAAFSLSLFIAAPSVAWASDNKRVVAVVAQSIGAQIFEQRKDVDEVSRPQPASGPATPVPFCSPGQPICP